MKNFDRNTLQKLPSRQRAHLINTLCGLRSANLVGTRGISGDNLAIFNSVFHLGSNPALLGIVFRPLSVERHTYDNIKERKSFSINQLPIHLSVKGHHSSAKFDSGTSEFDAVGIPMEKKEGLDVPFVKESNIQMLCTYSHEHLLENECVLLTATIDLIWVAPHCVEEEHWINHQKAESLAIGGLDTYYTLSLLDRYSYAQPEHTPKSLLP